MSRSLDDCIASGGGTPAGAFPAPAGALPTSTTAGLHAPCRGRARTLDDCIAAGSGTPGTIPSDEEVERWEMVGMGPGR